MINQNPVARYFAEQIHHRFFEFLVVNHNRHALPTQDIAGPDQDRITHFVGDLQGFFGRFGHAVSGVGNVKVFEQITETTPVFGQVHALVGGSNDSITMSVDFLGQFEGRLSTQLNNDANGLFVLKQVQQMLPKNRLEIKFIGHVKVGAHRFGVAIDHNGLKTRFTCRQKAVDAGIIKFDPLPDPIGARAQHHNFGLGADNAFVFLVVGRIEIRGQGRKLGRTGVHHFPDPLQAQTHSSGPNLLFGHIILHHVRDLYIREPVLFEFVHQITTDVLQIHRAQSLL